MGTRGHRLPTKTATKTPHALGCKIRSMRRVPAKEAPREILGVPDRIALCVGTLVAIILFFEDRTNRAAAAMLLIVMWLAGCYVLRHLLRIFPWVRNPRAFKNSSAITLAVILILWTFGAVLYAKRVWPRRQLVVEIIFKDSPLWTKQRKKDFSEALDDFYLYLRGIGFTTFSRTIPPIGFAHTNINTSGGQIGADVYYSSIWLSDETADQPRTAVQVYSSYIFNNSILWDDTVNVPHDYKEDAAVIFACYFASSFGNKNICPEGWPNQKWLDATWDIRKQCGQDSTDKLMFYMFAMWKTFLPKAESVDSLLSSKLIAAQNVQSVGCDLQKILPSHGIAF
jgi:hypothetical protein